MVVGAFPGAVVDFVGGGEALILLSELLVNFDAGHCFGVSKVGLLCSTGKSSQFLSSLDLA